MGRCSSPGDVARLGRVMSFALASNSSAVSGNDQFGDGLDINVYGVARYAQREPRNGHACTTAHRVAHRDDASCCPMTRPECQRRRVHGLCFIFMKRTTKQAHHSVQLIVRKVSTDH